MGRSLVCACAWLFIMLPVAVAQAPSWNVGVATTVITPETPIHLVGYGNRPEPFTGVDTELFAKALAFEDRDGYRAVLVTADLVGFQDIFFGPVCERVMKDTGLTRAQIMLNASHTHTGPLMSLNPDATGNLAYSPLGEDGAREVVAYTRRLQEKVYGVMMAALADLQPAHLAWGSDRVEFVMNRRTIGEDGVVRMKPNPDGPTDPVVPVMSVTRPGGALRAILFGCACHNTGLTADHNVVSGDYAGYASEALEARYPGALALFKSGCGADANPEPRADIPGVRKLGVELADAVIRVLESDMRTIDGPLCVAYRNMNLPFQKLTPAQVTTLAAKNDVVGLMAKHMERVLASGGTLRKSFNAPLAVWAFGDDLTIVGFPSETVAEFALNIRAEFPEKPIWVSSYNNDFFGYVPTAQIVREGGHETIGVTTWLWGTDLGDAVGLFSEEAESVMMKTSRELINEVSGAPSR